MATDAERAALAALGPEIENLLAGMKATRRDLYFIDAVLDAMEGKTERLEKLILQGHPRTLRDSQILIDYIHKKIKPPRGRPPSALAIFTDKKIAAKQHALRLVRQKKQQMRARGEAVHGIHNRAVEDALQQLKESGEAVPPRRWLENALRRSSKPRKLKSRANPR
jgi:hypothetical protein